MNKEEKKELGYDPEREIEGLYGALPIVIISDSKLTPVTRLVAVVIAMTCSKTGFGHRSNRHIAKYTNVSIRAVETAFMQLEKQGYLVREWDNLKQQRFYQWTFETGKKYKKK